MSAKKVFHVKDKVFAKVRGYPAWPAIISGVKVDTPSKQRYNVYFYGTGERAECKPDELFPYEDNKSKLGKPNKRKFFAEALMQIEDDITGTVLPEIIPQESVTPSITSNVDKKSPLTNEPEKVDEVEKIIESNSESEGKLTIDEVNTPKGKKVSATRKSLGISVSKGVKRKISDGKPERSAKKPMPNKPKTVENAKDGKESTEPIVLVKRLNIAQKDEQLSAGELEKETNEQQKSDSEENKDSTDTNITTNNTINDNNDAEKISSDEQVSETNDKQLETVKTEYIVESNDKSLDTSKTSKSLLKIRDSPTSGSDMSSSNTSNVGPVSRSGRKIKPKKYSDYENDKEVPKRSRLSKDNSKNSEKQNSSSIENDNSSEQNYKTTKDTNSETKKTSKSVAASTPLIIDSAVKEINRVSNKIQEDKELPEKIKGLMTGVIENIKTDWKKSIPRKKHNIEILNTEVGLLDCIYKLRQALRIDYFDYEKAIDLLEQINDLQFNALMLKKHQEVVDTIVKTTKYVGNLEEWNLNDEKSKEFDEQATKIRRKASTIYNKIVSLFAVPDGHSFQQIFNNQVQDFFSKTKDMACDQIYGLTSEKQLLKK